MSLNYAIFKNCPKLARKLYLCETSVYSTNFGDSWRLVVSVFGFGHPKSHFWHQKTANFSDFGRKKVGLLTAIFENGDHFLSPSIPNNVGIDTCFT